MVQPFEMKQIILYTKDRVIKIFKKGDISHELQSKR